MGNKMEKYVNPKIVLASKQTWNSIIGDTLWKMRDLLNATRILLEDVEQEEEDEVGFTVTTGDPVIPAGLYTFAVEEYGKFLYLKSLEPIDEKYHIDYVKEFTNHAQKFKRALSELPEECKLIHQGEPEDSKCHELDFEGDIVADFEARLRIFYSDFDPRFANKVTTQSPSVSVKILKIAVEKLWEIENSKSTEHLSKKKS